MDWIRKIKDMFYIPGVLEGRWMETPHLLVVVLGFVPHVKIFLQRVFSEAAGQTPLLLDLPQGDSVRDHLHKA